MTDTADGPRPSIPADDLNRKLTIAEPDSSKVRHVAVAGDAYSILVSGADTAGRCCLIDMLVPDGGGPPPHRHDFEEMFTVIEGELELTFRGQTATVRAGSTVSIPANAPHAFKNTSGSLVHMLCFAAPAGLDEFFLEVGDPLPSRASPPPRLDKAQMEERIKKIKLSPRNTARNSWFREAHAPLPLSPGPDPGVGRGRGNQLAIGPRINFSAASICRQVLASSFSFRCS